jgi:hypothetical protein
MNQTFLKQHKKFQIKKEEDKLLINKMNHKKKTNLILFILEKKMRFVLFFQTSKLHLIKQKYN